MYVFIYVTTSDIDEAKSIGRALVEERLAACVNIFPITSIYRWEGVQEDNEGAMIVKTTSERVRETMDRIKQLHSYEVPCICVFAVERGNQEYLKWIEESVMKE
jgi:periplasmic divalent cation tolerance protein